MVGEVDDLHAHQRSKFVPGMHKLGSQDAAEDLYQQQLFFGDEGEGDVEADDERECDDEGSQELQQQQQQEEDDNGMVVVGEEDLVSSSLTLMYMNQTYIIDDVSAEKFQMVLHVLAQNADVTASPSAPDTPPYSSSRRAECIQRYKEKRARRFYGKKIRYQVRQDVASRQGRSKGQFTRKKSTDESNEERTPPPGTTTCTMCGKSSAMTPMMRTGPAGPKTLCNACGLKWSNKRKAEAEAHYVGKPSPAASSDVFVPKAEVYEPISSPFAKRTKRCK